MNVEEFYDADPRRRESAELQFGSDWVDRHGRRYELNWIEDTGELYVLQGDQPAVWTDPFGDFFVVPLDDSDVVVRVLKQVHGRENVEALLAGWETAMAQPDSIAWLVERLRPAHTA